MGCCTVAAQQREAPIAANWKKAGKKPLKNVDLWRELLGLSRFHEVKWVKMKGHSGNPGNERCHALVQVAIAKKCWS